VLALLIWLSLCSCPECDPPAPQSVLNRIEGPGTRPITSRVMVAAIGTGDVFSKGRDFAAHVTGQGIACNASAELDTLMQDRKPTDRRKPLATRGRTIHLDRGLGRAHCH